MSPVSERHVHAMVSHIPARQPAAQDIPAQFLDEAGQAGQDQRTQQQGTYTAPSVLQRDNIKSLILSLKGLSLRYFRAVFGVVGHCEGQERYRCELNLEVSIFFSKYVGTGI